MGGVRLERLREVEAPELEQEAREPRPAARPRAPVESIFLSPVAAPAILGLYGFAAAQFAVALGLVGAYGPPSELFIAPFAALLGGVAQFAAAMWAFRARDGLGTGMLGVWGSFWIGYGLLFLLFAGQVLVQPVGIIVGLGIVFIPLAAITYVGAVAATQVNWALSATLFLLASGAAVAAAANLTGIPALSTAAGWVFIFAAVAGWWTASGLLLKSVFGRVILPIGETRRSADITEAWGEPGVF